MSKEMINNCKSVGLIVLSLIYQYIPIIILMAFGIDYNSCNSTSKMIYLLITSLGFMFFLYFIYRVELKDNYKTFIDKPLSFIKIAFKLWALGLVAMITSNLIINTLNGGEIAANEKYVRELLGKYPLFMFFQIAIYAPFTEELIFRKSIKDAINNKYLYIIMSGLVFGGLHIISDIGSINDVLYIIPYGALGCAFAVLYNKTDNIFSSIFIHSFHNMLTFLLFIIVRSFG